MNNKAIDIVLKARELILVFATDAVTLSEEVRIDNFDRAFIDRHVNEFNKMGKEVANLNRQFIKELARVEAGLSDEDLLSMMVNASTMYVTPIFELNEKVTGLIDEAEKGCNGKCSCKDICNDDAK